MYQSDKNTYVKLWRSLLNNGFLMSDNNAYIVFTRLLLVADRKTATFTTGRYALAELCSMKPSTVRDVLKRLEKEKLIEVTPDYSKSKIRICNWEHYQGQPVTSPSPARRGDDTKQEEEREVDTKVSTAKTPRTDIDEMFQEWKAITGMEIVGQTTKNRYACSNLLKKHGKDKLTQLIKGVALAQSDQYAPRISDFSALQAKQNDLIAWGKTKQSTAKAKVVVI